jgi:hypothetical protein
MSWLRLLVALPPSRVWSMLLVRWPPVHVVAHQDAMYRRDCHRYLVKALQIVGNPAGPAVAVLPKIQNLADDLRRNGHRRPMRSRRASPQAGLTVGVEAPFPSIERLARKSQNAGRFARYSVPGPTLLSEPCTATPTGVFALLLSSRLHSRVVAKRRARDLLPVSWDFTQMSWRRRPIRDLNNSEQFGSDAIRRQARGTVEHLGIDVHCGVDFGVSHDLRDHLHWHALVVCPGGIRSPECAPLQARRLTRRPDPILSHNSADVAGTANVRLVS